MSPISMQSQAEVHSAMGQGTGKETVLRVKRKRDDVQFDSLWLEVTSRPIKRHEPNLAELSLGDATAKTPKDAGTSSKLLFRRVDTLSPSAVKELSLPEFILKVKDKKRSREKQEPRQTRNTKEKQVQLLAAAKEHREVHARTARFEQVWRSRRRDGRKKEDEDPMQELFHLFDVVHVNVDTESAAKRDRRKQAKRDAELREGQLLCNYLPLLREVLPDVAAEIEAVSSHPSQIDDGEEASPSSNDYVYDVYTLDDETEDSKQGETNYPTIQLMADDNQDWKEARDPDYDSEDSNDENNPNNDYPEEDDEEFAADGDGNSDSSDEVDPYSMDNEEYDTVLSDEERDIWKPRR